jgi:hypothetical protein
VDYDRDFPWSQSIRNVNTTLKGVRRESWSIYSPGTCRVSAAWLCPSTRGLRLCTVCPALPIGSQFLSSTPTCHLLLEHISLSLPQGLGPGRSCCWKWPPTYPQCFFRHWLQVSASFSGCTIWFYSPLLLPSPICFPNSILFK